MELTVSTPALLFSTVSLLMIAFTNRFLALASLIRDLHEKFQNKPDTFYVAQIRNLHRRLLLIRNIQVMSVLSLLLSAICMFVIFQGDELTARWLFGSALVLQIAALTLSAVEISISINALQIELSDMEKELGQRRFERAAGRLFSLRSRGGDSEPQSGDT